MRAWVRCSTGLRPFCFPRNFKHPRWGLVEPLEVVHRVD